MYIQLLGQTATAEQAVQAAQLGIDAYSIKPKAKELELTQLQIQTLRQKAYEQTLGITAIRASTDAQRIEGDVVGMAAGQAAAYTAFQNALNDAKRNGRVLTDQQVSALRGESAALGQAAQRADDLRFGYDTFSSTMRDVGQNLRNGVGLWDSFAKAGVNALGKIADRLMDMASRALWQAAFPTGGGGIFSGIGSFFGIGATQNHTGYGPGDPPGPARLIPADIVPTLPRFHTGIGPGERAAVIRNDESVLTPGQMKAIGNAGANVTITNYNDFRGADPGSEARMKAYVDQSSQKTLAAAVQAVQTTKRNTPSYLG